MQENNTKPLNRPDYSNLSSEETLAVLRCLYRIPPEMDMINGLHDTYKQAMGTIVIDHETAKSRVEECLKTEDPLLAFAAWYTTWLNGNLRFCPMYYVKQTKLGMGMTMFEMKPFRVELFLFRPQIEIPEHIHPDVESYEVYIAGDMELTKDSIPQTKREFVKPNENRICMSNGGMIRIPAESVHGGWTSGIDTGGAFLSIQFWKRNWHDDSVMYNWKGLDKSTHG